MYLDYDSEYIPTVKNLKTSTTFHMGIIKNVDDPEGRNRVKVEIPGLLGEGEEKWTDYIDRGGIPYGAAQSKSNKGDYGLIVPPQPNQTCFVGFLGGDPDVPFYIPGPPTQKNPGNINPGDGDPNIPEEVKRVGKKKSRDATRIWGLKSVSGAGLIIDDRGQEEKVELLDQWGAGLSIFGPGKEKDEEDQKDKESKSRDKPHCRKCERVMDETSKSPGELKEGYHSIRLADLNGQGIMTYAAEGKGAVMFISAKKNGEIGPSMFLDAENDQIIFSTGESGVQLVLNGKKGQIEGTRYIIQEKQRQQSKEAIEKTKEALKRFLQRTFGIMDT